MPDQPSGPIQSSSWAVNWMLASQGYNIEQTAVTVMATDIIGKQQDNLDAKRTSARQNYRNEREQIQKATYEHIKDPDPTQETSRRSAARDEDLDIARKAFEAEMKRYDDRDATLTKVNAHIASR